jgi:hypothetical protein
MTQEKWAKTSDGYTITDPKWGATLTLVTDRAMSDKQLMDFLEWLYQNASAPLPKGGHYSLFPMGPIQ